MEIQCKFLKNSINYGGPVTERYEHVEPGRYRVTHVRSGIDREFRVDEYGLVHDDEQGAWWNYTLFYGMDLGVSFDAASKLVEVDGPLLADENIAKELAREIGD